ncbi:MAG: thiol reductant ABC exporter subunit CydC [Streptococcaceae bacterium]|jgi:ATP-binding cassette subfamily C protein CydC|nr:thiol reductant ABC exporter subunit CydC [Streptococcaceae bacterium]
MKFLTSEWILPFFKKYKNGQLLAIFLGLLTMLSAGLLMFSSGYVISRSATLPENILIIYVPTLMVRIFGIARPVLKYVERLTSHNWILRITSNLRKKLYLRLETEAIELSNRHRLGEMLGLLNEDIANLQNLYLRTIFPLLIGGSLVIALLIISGIFSIWLMLGLAVILAILYFLLPFISLKMTVKSDERLKIYRNDLYSNLTDNILGLQDWQLSGRKDDFLSIYKKAEKSSRNEQKHLFAFARKRNLALQLVYALLILFLMIWASTNLRSGDAPNYIAAVVLGVFPLFDAFSPLSDAVVETHRYQDSVKRLDALPNRVEVERTQTITNSDIQLKNVSFAYEDEKPVLSSISLDIPKGQHLAILGRSGVGKSTLASLVRGDLIPSSGSLTIGGIAPSKAANVEKKIGVINQEPYIFNTTLRNNLTLANLSATDEEILSALEAVGLQQMVSQLPEGLDTMVDEAGQRFSGGEGHRLALARILLSNVDIVILDEATLGLDPITEKQLLKECFRLLADKTILFITHHLLGVKQLDRVIQLKNGSIKIDGQPSDLMNNNPEFIRLYQLDKGF